ncbi:hypothetical protein HERIO_2440 [Hepatospora eriocheir]|uniref:Uncharacterized protein n=1 Tax=Hepatospora eriocheir TaxID=1081669 RepID=A0A1X0Q6W6_9MICR|nr:hypothetical protein HERIO_2440 [Hepatospora eriocheir]
MKIGIYNLLQLQVKANIVNTMSNGQGDTVFSVKDSDLLAKSADYPVKSKEASNEGDKNTNLYRKDAYLYDEDGNVIKNSSMINHHNPERTKDADKFITNKNPDLEKRDQNNNEDLEELDKLKNPDYYYNNRGSGLFSKLKNFLFSPFGGSKLTTRASSTLLPDSLKESEENELVDKLFENHKESEKPQSKPIEKNECPPGTIAVPAMSPNPSVNDGIRAINSSLNNFIECVTKPAYNCDEPANLRSMSYDPLHVPNTEEVIADNIKDSITSASLVPSTENKDKQTEGTLPPIGFEHLNSGYSYPRQLDPRNCSDSPHPFANGITSGFPALPPKRTCKEPAIINGTNKPGCTVGIPDCIDSIRNCMNELRPLTNPVKPVVTPEKPVVTPEEDILP